jgi:DHA1 family tetracycline resistance protein-like MFS transporter
LGSLLGFGLDYLLLAIAPTIGWLFVGRFLAGITGASFSTASAYIADVTPPDKRAQSFGMLGAAFGLGFIIGPALGGFLGSYGSRVPFYASACLTLLNWLYGYFVLPESLKPENRRPFDWKRANPIGSLMHLKKYSVIFSLIPSLILIFLAQYALQSTWTYYTMEKFQWSEKVVGLSLAVVGLTVAIVQGGLTRIIIPKLGTRRSLFLGLTFSGLSMLAYGLATEGWMLFVIMLPAALAGLSGPSIQSIMSTQVPPNEQGELQGAITSLNSFTSIFGPLLMTYLFSYFTSPKAPVHLPAAPFFAGAFLTVLSVIFAFNALMKN